MYSDAVDEFLVSASCRDDVNMLVLMQANYPDIRYRSSAAHESVRPD